VYLWPAYAVAAVAIGVGLDWAFYERTMNVMTIFYPLKKEYNYFDSLFPRIVGIVVASLICLYGVLNASHRTYVIIAGAAIFMIFNSYAYFSDYRDHR